MEPVQTPWGGGNQVVEQLITHFRSRGITVTHSLEEDIDLILMIDPRPSSTTRFLPEEILEFRRKHPGVKCIHRINECDKRKNTDFMDEILRKANEAADFTVFISEWLRGYFIERWFDVSKPHATIDNGADPKVFYPAPAALEKGPFKIVTHHWSSNAMKGFDVYRQIDQMLAGGELEGFEFTVIGRWPEDIQWKKTLLHPPARGMELAGLLRNHHAYVTASLWEPSGMHHIEGAQCGLPLVYHEDGGGIVDFGRKYGVCFRENIREALLKVRENYDSLRKKVLEYAPSGLKMCEEYYNVLLKLTEKSG